MGRCKLDQGSFLGYLLMGMRFMWLCRVGTGVFGDVSMPFNNI